MIMLPGLVQSAPPGIVLEVISPQGEIAPYPNVSATESHILSINEPRFSRLPLRIRSKPKVIRSDFKNGTLTFGSSYYKKGRYEYFYIPRAVDAVSYYEFRKAAIRHKDMLESRARVLSKGGKDKKRGLLEFNVPIRSGTFESIAGEGGVGLKVSGTHQISFSGRSTWDDKQSTARYQQSKFPSLNMEQISRFTINGEIGSKITVSVTQDSKSDVPLANRLMIRYKGDDDDIIKSIEAGNTTLSLPNTQFVGYSTRIQGLFGIKAEAQVGGLKLTTIASQEKGSTERTSIDAGASAGKIRIYDYNYLDGKIIDLGQFTDFREGDKITKLLVYKSLNTQYQDTELGDAANLYVDPDDTTEYVSENMLQHQVKELEPTEYALNDTQWWIMFRSPVRGSSQIAIGVWMEITNSELGEVDTVGNVDESPYKLKLIKHKTPDPSFLTWNYVWRNVYSLSTGSGFSQSSSELELDGLEIDIFRGDYTSREEENLNHQSGQRYIQILGLDQRNDDNDTIPDNRVDVYNYSIVDPYNSLLIFPSRTPFDDSLNAFLYTDQGQPILLNEPFPEIYDYAHSDLDNIQKNKKFYIEVSTKSRASEISLGKPNIIEGSEQITLNNSTLTKGDDYTINYDFGRVTFLNEDALDPNADLSIDFEYSPFILAQKKTLFGVRGEYEISKNFKLGSTFLYKSDKATDRKPKVGQETSRMMVWDVDGKITLRPNFLTTIANALPLYSTEAPSNLSISGEFAQSYPNPNIDGVAYIDDFEGSRDAYSLGVFREFWDYASKPLQLDSASMRAKLIWFNPYEQVPTKEIWNQQTAQGEGFSHVLTMQFNPEDIDRRAGKIDSGITDIDEAISWGGIVRSLPGGAIYQERAELLEIRVKGDAGILHIDMGRISEDIDGDGVFFSEDSLGAILNLFEDNEDVGLDGMNNGEEQKYYGELGVTDPSGDDWYFDDAGPNYDYRYINGTDKNRDDPDTFGKTDTEDIDNDRSPDLFNSYYSFRVNLADPLGDDNFLVEGSRDTVSYWKTYRIPIKNIDNIDTAFGDTSWARIEYVRLWMDNPDARACSLSIAALDIISSNWVDTLVVPQRTLDSIASSNPDELPKFSVAVINNKENINYTSPSGVEGHYNQTTGITENEQSLLLKFENFKVRDSAAGISDTGIALRYLISPTNLLGYQRLNMFVHGPPKEDVDSLLFFFRIGTDSLNYYEYSEILREDWAELENEVNIEFDEITNLKIDLEEDRKIDPNINEIVDTIPHGIYKVRGKPDISRVKYIASGVVNQNPGKTATGEVWIDELRLTDVRRDVGTAMRISASGSFADLFTYNFGYSYQNEFFRKISAATRGGGNNNLGSGRSTRSYNYGISFKLENFLPRSFKARIPISFRYQENKTTPLLKSGSDIVLLEENRVKETTVNTSKSFSISEAFSKSTKNPLFTVLLNNLKTSFSLNRSDGQSPTAPMTMSENIRFTAKYDLPIRKPPSIRPFFWTKPIPILNRLSENNLFLFINSFNANGDVNRSLRITRNSSNVLSNSYRRDFKGGYRVSYKIFDNMTANYNMTTRRDLANSDKVSFSFSPFKLELGKETNYTQSFSVGYNPTLFSFLTHKANFSSNYREDLNIQNDTRNVSLSKSYSIAGVFDHMKLFGSDKRKRRVAPVRRDREVTQTAEEKDNIVKKILRPPAKVLAFMTGWINAFNYDFKETYNYSYVGLLERAQLKFRFGFSDAIGAAQDSTIRTTGRSNSISKSTGYSLRSGTTFLGGLKTDVTFRRSIRQDVKTTVNPQKTVSTVFPDINFTLRNFRKLTFLNYIVKNFSPRFKYSRSKDQTIDLNSGHNKSEKVTVAMNPLLSVNFNVFKGMVINFKTSRTVTESKSFNASDGSVNQTNTSTQNSSSVSTKYSFSWPRGFKFPFLGRLRIKSTLSLSVDVSLRSQNNEEFKHATQNRAIRERNDLLISPSISYSFSSQIRGGLSGRWQDTEDKTQDRKSHVRELRIWVDIKF